MHGRLSPEHAATIAAEGWSKDDVKRAIYEAARIPMSRYSQANIERRLWRFLAKRYRDRPLHTPVSMTQRWEDIRLAVPCWPAQCEASSWDAASCQCSTKAAPSAAPAAAAAATIPARVLRGGQELAVDLPDPKPRQRAGDVRSLKARPVLPLSPFLLGAVVFLISVCVIGTHGVLSGTATMDFGGRKGAATAVGMIDGFVYLGTALQSVSLGVLTTKSWGYWPPFLIPFGFIGFLLCLRIWNAKPKAASKPPAAEPSDAKAA